VTDAHLVLGHLPPNLLDGRMTLDVGRATQAIADRVAAPLGLGVEEAARGILAIVDNNMVGALRIVSVERGHDPRDFTLTPFGGAGPLHGCALAALIGITRVLIPPAPGVLCADGLLHADLKSEFSRTLPRAGVVDPGRAAPVFAELEAQAAAWFAAEGVAARDRETRRFAMLRYRGQGGEIAVPWIDTKPGLEAAFARAHADLYGFTLEAAIELVTLRVEATGRMLAPARQHHHPGRGARPSWHRMVHLATGPAEVPVYDRARLGAGDSLSGPAIVTQLDATTFVAPHWNATVHDSGAIVLTTVASAAEATARHQ
jgi:N-methylhydantoinase A